MSYIGNPIISTDFPKDTFSGTGSATAFTMSIAPASVNAVMVIVSGVTQDPSTYTISGTTLTFSAAPPSGTNNISVRHLGVAGIPNVPADASVTSAKLASGAALANLGSSQLASANLPAGSVLQVVNAVYPTYTTSASATFADTGITATITPKFSTSKILAIATISSVGKNGSNTALLLRLVRDSTTLSKIEGASGYTNTTGMANAGSSFTYLDSPATTSSTIYKVQLANAAGAAGTVWINNYYNSPNDSVSSITLMEIAQ